MMNVVSEISVNKSNPFLSSHAREAPAYRLFKYAIGGCILLPCRLAISLVLAGSITSLAVIASINLPPVSNKPHSWWRLFLLRRIPLLLKLLLYTWGFYIKTTGKFLTGKDRCPIIVANHSSMIDSLYLASLTVPCGISRIENLSIPVLSSVLRATQSILVDRANPDSRKETKNQIHSKAQKAMEDPRYFPLLIFPEGTTTNGKSLICFKIGAFSPGLPVQPVCFSYPNRYCDLSWTMNSLPIALQLVKIMCQFVNYMKVDFLPPYIPTEQERMDPIMFANNVRAKIAEKLCLPTSNHTFEDISLLIESKKLSLPMDSVGAVEVKQIERLYNLSVKEIQEYLRKFSEADRDKSGTIDTHEFAQMLNLPINDTVLDLFYMFDRDGDGLINFKEFLVGLTLLNSETDTDSTETIRRCFHVLDMNGDGYITFDEFSHIFSTRFEKITKSEICALFDEIPKKLNGRISFDEFSSYAQTHKVQLKLASSLITHTNRKF